MTNNKDPLRIAREALEQIAETPNAGWMIARQALAQMDQLAPSREAPADADLVEVVARAICRADPEVHMGDAYGVVEQRVYTEWHRYGWQARAALSALGLPARLQAAKDAGREESAGIAERQVICCDNCAEWMSINRSDVADRITSSIRERIRKP